MNEEKQALMELCQQAMTLKRKVRQLFILVVIIALCLVSQAVVLANSEWNSSECEYIPMNCSYDYVTESHKCNYVKNPLSTQDDENYKEFAEDAPEGEK